MKRFLALLCFIIACLEPVHAQFSLVQTGGTFKSGVTNLAAGGTAFAFDELSGGTNPNHKTFHLNDGVYGNANSWIGDAATTYAGIVLAAPTTLGSFAFGRDNLGSFADRDTGTYIVQVSFNPISGFNAATASWTTVGTLNYGSSPPTSPALRHLYELTTPLAGVTAFRLVTQGGIGSGQAIDEIELYAIPEPATVAALLGAAALFLAIRRRRARSAIIN